MLYALIGHVKTTRFTGGYYYKNKFELAIKFIENSDILIEIETESNTEWDTIEKIKTIISEMKLPIEKGEYFIKKAENEINKILNR